MLPSIAIKRVYDLPSKTDGVRILVDRLWPRGLTKEKAAVDDWEKELAPSTDLRKWYDHSPLLWPAFQKKYLAELKTNTAVSDFVRTYHKAKKLTLLYAAQTTTFNHAIVLQHYLHACFAPNSTASNE